MQLPICPFRAKITRDPDRALCLHPQVHAPDCLVYFRTCLGCDRMADAVERQPHCDAPASAGGDPPWLEDLVNGREAGLDGPVSTWPPEAIPCPHRSPAPLRLEECQLCGLRGVRVAVYGCGHFGGECTLGPASLRQTRECLSCPARFNAELPLRGQ